MTKLGEPALRVLYLVDGLGNGGLERQLALLATRLPEDWEPRVWAMDGGPFEDYLLNEGIPVLVRRRRARFDPLPAAQLWQDLRSWRPDIVHSWGWMPALAAGPFCRALRIACIDGMIQSGALEPDFTRLKRLGMASATLVVANTRAGLRAWGIGPARGRVVYNGFDQARLESLGDGSVADPATVHSDHDRPHEAREGLRGGHRGRQTPQPRRRRLAVPPCRRRA